jgi:hypothetical protein
VLDAAGTNLGIERFGSTVDKLRATLDGRTQAVAKKEDNASNCG